LRILHLEDNAADRELVRQALVQEEIACDYVYAQDRIEFAAALQAGNIDLILSDFALPGYDGISALALAREKRPEVPFLFVSGTIGEERAIESLKSGATDYVLKERLERLLPAVRRALRDTGERTARHDAEEALRRAEARFRDIFENAVEGIYQSDPAGRLLAANRAMALLCGYPSPEALCAGAKRVAELHVEPPCHAEFTRLLNERGEALAYESRIRRTDGTVIWISENARAVRDTQGVLLHYESMVTEITARKATEEALRQSEAERRQLQAQLLQAQKMEAVGQLAGGLAHDFNNVLTIVIGYSRLLLDRGTLPPEAVKPLTEIFTAGTRAANLTRQLLVFSCNQTIKRQTLDLNAIAVQIAEMLGRLIGDHIKLALALAPARCLVDADAGMMEQVLINLAVNARDAMPNGGTLTIASEPITIVDAAHCHHPEARPGEFVCLSVRDTGSGISPENLRRIFEPFFTTKDVGRGTGLGLAMVFGIVKQHQGWIEVETAMGTGTCFRLLLPAAPKVSAVASEPPDARSAAARGSETILLVEDEPAVREFTVAVLQGLGYRVLQATSGIEALEVWRWHSSRIALLLTDLVMPDGLGGVELAARLRQERPALKVVLTSGYANEMTGEAFRQPSGSRFIQKPYNPQALAQMVRDALDDRFDR
jgi:hypothetical protein